MKTKRRRKTPVFFRKVSERETDEQVADAICEALLPLVNEARREEGLGPLPD